MTINVTLCTLMINSLLCWTESTITCLPCDFCLSGTKPKDLNTHPPTLAANTSLSLSLSLSLSQFFFLLGWSQPPRAEGRGRLVGMESSWKSLRVIVFLLPFFFNIFLSFSWGLTCINKEKEIHLQFSQKKKKKEKKIHLHSE